MNNGEIDRIPVSQLEQRYDLARSAVYKRLKDLGIKPQRVGIKSYLNAQQIMLMDEFHAFVQGGGTMAEFLEFRGSLLDPVDPPQDSPMDSSNLALNQPDMIRLVSAIAAEIATQFQPPPPEPDLLAYFEALERAAQKGWLLKTSELSAFLDLTPAEIQSYGDRFAEAGFLFTRAGYRAGGEVAWRVSKV